MKKSKKIVSFLLALTMMLAAFIPSLINAASDSKTAIVIHKILMKDKATLDNHTDANKSPKYEGGQIADIKGYFGNDAKEIKDVAFDIYKEDSTGNTEFEGKKYKKVKTVKTEDSGVLVKDLEPGNYYIVENKQETTYVGPNQELLAGSKAVPMKITLPMAKADGTGNFGNDKNSALHLYPKNVQEKPTIEKTFEDGSKKLDEMIGKEIPYKVTTTIKAGTEYKTLKWTDTMVKGIDFVKGSLKIQYDGKDLDNTHYTLTETERGYILTLNDKGLAAVQDKNKDVVVTLTYKGILNETAIVDTDIPNKIQLDYGNKPGVDSEPKSGKPNGKKITVQKTFEGEFPDGVTVKFNVYEKATGKFVETLEISKAKPSAETTVPLDDNKEYVVIEEEVNGYKPEYKSFENGVVKVNNHKNPNPPPITPENPIVKTYGKKFVKVDSTNQNKKLSGAEFIIINKNAGADNGKFLALKDADTQATNKAAYDEAEKNYQDAIKEANSILEIQEDKRTQEQKQKLNLLNGNEVGSINALKKLRDEAFEKLNFQWTWVADESKAFKFVSQKDGTFEVKGLNKGKYDLKETKAPAGYALPADQIVAKDFKIESGSYAQEALKVNNVKVTIPQTGGMGAVIVVLCGLAVVGVGIVIKKKINA
ncbi:isopeptide-forming domain-containing fimbrial protein [Parvimonas micra]|uniref:isopeptide-forming domain-containing fimbrial protein n=2 Tax=Parvimonas micra TaxID=33033 RepID=UPI002B47F321|nr:isopeptide-forming domain-containing fimbrial protein [Parvimonas micra]MEB3059618.1 isopeptide-forming domain-containing fimbrial protein [Parvimonas micra]MEB3066087.1 isopeptide-forming domain-containing fimbrial protein [Parvimonas micra]